MQYIIVSFGRSSIYIHRTMRHQERQPGSHIRQAYGSRESFRLAAQKNAVSPRRVANGREPRKALGDRGICVLAADPLAHNLKEGDLINMSSAGCFDALQIRRA